MLVLGEVLPEYLHQPPIHIDIQYFTFAKPVIDKNGAASPLFKYACFSLIY
jgi:hypothetical protein